MEAFAFRLLCKAAEYLLRALTFLRRPFASDPTAILTENFTDAQRQAVRGLTPALDPQHERPAARILVLLPFRDEWPLTAAALRSLQAQVSPRLTIRVALLDNGSVRHETKVGIAAALAAAHPGMDVVHSALAMPFNYSRVNNLGVAAHAGFLPEWLFFLNNDVELPATNAVDQLVTFARQCPQLGALGCTLDYPDGRVQHLFAAPGVKIVAAHPFRGRVLPSTSAWFAEPRPVAAVTGAAMLLRASVFAEVGGFDEALPTVGQDIDLCLRLQRLGLTNWTLPQVRLIHKEGASRGRAIDRGEVARMYAKWGDSLRWNPYYSDRFSRYSETPAYRVWEPAYPWSRVLQTPVPASKSSS